MLEGRTFHSLSDMVLENKIGPGHLAERQGDLAVSLRASSSSVLLHALQESDSRLCGKLVGLELLHLEVSISELSPVSSGAFCFPVSCGLPPCRPKRTRRDPYTGKANSEGKSVDLIETFVWLLAFIVLLACLGRLFDALEALEKRERDH